MRILNPDLTYGIFGDVHTRLSGLMDTVARRKDVDRWICLGDWQDEFNPVASPRAVAATLHGWLVSKQGICIWGNHDVSYYDWDRRCSGWHPDTQAAMDSQGLPWHRFHLGVRLDDWIITHAGVTAGLYKGRPTIQAVYSDLQEAEAALLAKEPHFLLEAGESSGGSEPFGGCIWTRWRQDFQPISGIPQIVGHTPIPSVQRCDNAYNIDTNMQHYAVWRKGVLEFFPIAGPHPMTLLSSDWRSDET